MIHWRRKIDPYRASFRQSDPSSQYRPSALDELVRLGEVAASKGHLATHCLAPAITLHQVRLGEEQFGPLDGTTQPVRWPQVWTPRWLSITASIQHLDLDLVGCYETDTKRDMRPAPCFCCCRCCCCKRETIQPLMALLFSCLQSAGFFASAQRNVSYPRR